jgi:hypothetical protein
MTPAPLRLLAVMALAGGGAEATAQDSTVQPLEPVDLTAMTCPCEFYQSVPGVAEGSYGAGPLMVVLDQNGDPPSIIVNLGAGNATLEPPDTDWRPLYECTRGEDFTSGWGSAGASASLELTVLGPGEEACWFEGQVSAEKDGAIASVPVKGACGC